MSSEPAPTVSNSPFTSPRLQFLCGVLTTAVVLFCLVEHFLAWTLTAGWSLAGSTIAGTGLIIGLIASSWLRAGSKSAWGVMAVSVVAVSFLQSGLLETLLDSGISVFGLSPAAFVFPALLTTILTALAVSLVPAVNPSFRAAAIGALLGLSVLLIHSAAPFPMWISLLALVSFALVVHWRTPWGNAGAVGAANRRQLLALGIMGLNAAAALRLVSVFMPLSIGSLLVTGVYVSAALFPVGLKSVRERLTGRVALWGGMLVCVLPVIGSGWISTQHLEWNVSGDFSVLFFGRGLIAAGVVLCFSLFPLQLLLTVSAPQEEATPARDQSVGPLVCLVAGAVAGLWLQAIPLTFVLLCVIGLSLLMGLILPRPENRPIRRVAFVPAIAVCLSVVLLNPVSQSTETLLLFSGAAASVHGQGFDHEVIPHALGVRLLDERTSENGHLTVWHTHGDEVEFRRNGFKSGACSTNSSITPQPVAESVTSLLPMILHQRPASVALIGDDTGAGLQAICEFPVDTVAAFRVDQAATALAKKYVWSQTDQMPADDSRVVMQHVAAGLAIRSLKANPRDVIVVDLPQTCSAGGQDLYTLEFYQQVHAGLKTGGIFCQRISEHDLGGDVLIRMISTVDSLFDRAIMARVSSGDILLIAGPVDLVDQQMLKRMQKVHVASVLARSGWDWSQLAALPVVDTHDAFGIFEHIPRLSPATVDNGWFAFSLPLERIRRANKSEEIRVTFAPHQRRLADAAPMSKEYAEFARRFSAVVQQAEILNGFPDQPMPYRKSLRTEMLRNPRPAVEQIVDGKVVQNADPRDEYRKNYFLALSEAVLQAEAGFVNPRVLNRLNEFAESYEPLLSHFAHHELIRIHEATEHPRPAMEMRHRLHTVYFTEPGDMSVRQVADALDQLLDDPEILPTVEARFDHTNSLLQELIKRWESRRGYKPLSSIKTRKDTEISIRVTKSALKQMQIWAKELKLDPSAVAMRRRYLNHQLISPLREYESMVIAHQRKHAVAAAREDLQLPRESDEHNELSGFPVLVPEDALTN